MKELCFETGLSDNQAKVKLESIFSNDIEFENIVYIRYKKSFTLKTKTQRLEDCSACMSKSIFDFFKIKIVLNQKEKGVSISLFLRTFLMSILISAVLLVFVWSVLAILNLPPFAENLYTVIAGLFSIYLFYRVYLANKLQNKVVRKLIQKIENF